ncbi:hypothetical protein D4Q76_02985 [archaeon]|nr:MAG: hypothetical protein D4Q76_02985 [archaeon]
MIDVFKILYKPKSILGLLIAGGILFLLIAGISIPVNKEVSQFFLSTGYSLLGIGIVGWLFFLLPSIVRNIQSLK